MTGAIVPVSIGADLERLDGALKVTGEAPYAYEQRVDAPAHLHPVQSTIARGRVTAVDTSAARALEGVLHVLTPANAPRLAGTDDAEFAVLQTDEVHYRGQVVAAVVADTPEVAREAAGLVRVEYDEQPHDVVLSRGSDLYAPDAVNPSFETDLAGGDVDAALASAAVTVDEWYSTPWENNNPMEPHTTLALWDARGFTVHDSTQGVHAVKKTLVSVFGLDADRVRVIAPHVGGGFGSKGNPHPHEVLVCLAAQAVPGRTVKYAVTRQQMFSFTGYRTPTIQRVRLGADASGRLTAVDHHALGQTARFKEFAEQTAVISRFMYAGENRSSTHRLAALDVPAPSWMRAPGECPGSFALETAMDELAAACGVDPVELRVRNDPERDPESGQPWSGRHLVQCLREGAERFGWAGCDPRPRQRLEDGWWVGTGVACSVYPAMSMPGNRARVAYGDDGRYLVQIGAADIGTGAWTALTQIAADALRVGVDRVRLEIGDSALPPASVAGGSSGTSSWGSAIVGAAEAFRAEHGRSPRPGDEVTAGAAENPDAQRYATYSFGAQFSEVRVHADTGEVRLARMLGVFDVGRVVNPRTARSQFLGAMTMGVSMALHEESVVDPRFGHVVNHDFAQYHIATSADVPDLRAHWIDGHDPRVNPMGTRGIGELGIVGAAACVANAAFHATGVRVRDLPLTPDAFLPG
ncbi:xanthine dehydrogenase family protein molybdopterin-binding subunit [Kineococcus sp. SYSU DK005]|uniref:xanthine dehydrogenase family protein molybdopterin-binding subunit n=1 Tax=Kineococcus sp. SYSU DK005 TaxID=3383126 RepID=UPI003D7E95DC